MSNINGDLLDDGLQAVMGKDRCRNDWHPEPKKKAPAKKAGKEPAKTDAVPVDAAWEAMSAGASAAKLKACAKWAMLFGSISALLFYWQQAGLLDPKAAVPSLIVCALGAGLSVGYHAR